MDDPSSALWTRAQLLDKQWRPDQIDEARRLYPRPSSPTHPVQSVASGDYYSYNTSLPSQSVGLQSNHPSVNYGQSLGLVINTVEPRGCTSYPESIAQPRPVRATGNTDLPDYASGVHTINSNDLRASVIDPREAQTYGYGEAANAYAATKSKTRDYVHDQAHGRDQGFYLLERQGSIRPGTAGTPVRIEQLQTEIPGAKSIPYRGTKKDPGEGPYGIWPTEPWDSAYFPTFRGKKLNKSCVVDLWKDVWQDEKQEQVCLLFDHVDFYRLAYITTVHRGTVERPGFWEFSEEIGDYETVNKLDDIVKILDNAGRPPGFGGISQKRPDNGFTYQQVSDLFSILANKKNPNRGKAFSQVLNWVNTHEFSPKRVLRNVPETIVRYYGYSYQDALANKRFRWEWQIESFLYKEDLNPKKARWFIEGPSKDKKDEPSGSGAPGKHSAHSSSRHSRHSHTSTSHHSHKPPHKKRQTEEYQA
ncbi:hypothetical protein EAF04_005901 [Stromatinia cepivora]|nr:hypothetical protein EAF04_005901 [Stromatinia cepivora]